MGGAVQSFSSPMLAQGMQGGLSGFGTSGLQTFADGGQTTTIQDILAKYKAMESAKPKQDSTTEFLNKSWEGKNLDDYIMYSDKYKRGGKMAKGGIFEHGLQEGDKIVKQVDDKYLIVASKGGVYSVVDIEKGSRFIVGLDDSKTSGKRKSVKAGVKEAMEYINYVKSTKMANGGKFAQGGMLEDAKIYVADLAEYNNGRLVGKWLDLSDYSSGAEVMEAIQEMLDEQTKKDKYGDVHEEYAIHDFEGFPRSFYSESMGESDFDELYEIAKIADSSNLPIDVLMEAVSDLGYEDDPERVAEAYYSSIPASMGNEWRDFAYEYIDSIGNITEAVSKPEYYFDFENFGSDIRMDYTDEELEEMGYNDLSDEELGEQMADEMGGVNYLGEKLIETYFDYDKFGRELEYDFISVRGKDGDYYFFNRNFAKGGKVKIKNFRKIESKGKTPKVPQEKWKVMVVSPYAEKDEAVYFNVSAKNKEEAEKLAKSLYSKKYNVPTTKLLIETALPYSHLNRFQIKNQYEGKTPKEIWNAMSLSQKEHFLKDHRVVCEVNFDEIKELYWLNWDELNDSPMKNNVVQAFTEHINEGQYAKGGRMSNVEMGRMKIKDWYKKNYKTDELGDELNPNTTFDDLFSAILNGDVYSAMGVHDSVVRERLFSKLSKIKGRYENYAYELYMKYGDKPLGSYAKGGEFGSIDFSDFSFDTDGDYEDRDVEEEKIKYLRTKIDFDQVRGNIDYRREENNTNLRFFKNGELVMRIKGDGTPNGVNAEISAYGYIGYLNYHPQDGFGGLNMLEFKREVNRVFEDFSQENKQYAKGGEVSELKVGDIVTHKKGRKYGHGRIYKMSSIGIYLEDKYGNKREQPFYFPSDFKKVKKMFADGGEVDKITPELNQKITKRAEEIYKQDGGKSQSDFDKAMNKAIVEYGFKPSSYHSAMMEIGADYDGADGYYAKGGEVKIVKRDEGNYWYRRYDGAIGSFQSKYENRHPEGILFPLNNFDKKFYADVKLKEGEVLFRYKTEIMKGGMRPLVKINLEKSLLYFRFDYDANKNEQQPKFQSKGVKAEYIVLEEGYDKKYAKGGKIGFEGLAKKVAKRYVGKKVSKEYQAEYGKTYDAKEAKEVGNKVAGKVYKQQVAKKKIVRKLQRKTK